MLSVLLYITIFFLICLYLYNYSKNRPKNFPPGPVRLPIWGSYWLLLKEHFTHPHLAFESLGKKYKTDILGFYLGDAPTIVPLSYELCRESLLKDEFAGRNDTCIIRLRSLGEPKGLFFIDGDKWRDQRRFSLRNLRDFGFGRRSDVVENFVIDEVRSLIEQLENKPTDKNKDTYPEEGVALMPDFIYAPMLNSALLLLASTSYDEFSLREFARAGLRFQRSGDATGSAISITPWLKNIAPEYFGFSAAEKSNNYMLNFLQGVIDQHRRTYIPGDCRDFIDVFIEEQDNLNDEKDGFGFTDEQLLLLLLDYSFPAAIAIGHTMNFYIAYLVNNPHVQRKIQEEIDEVVGNSRLPNLDDRKNMPYLEASIREGVRILPLNPLGIPRRCMEDTTFAGYFIPKDTIVLPSVYTAHKDPRVWKNPEQFLPERFLDENGQLMKKDLTLGFGGGKRLCAGETFARHNMFLLTAGLLQHFTLKGAYTDTVDLSKLVPGVNMSIDNNYVRFVPR